MHVAERSEASNPGSRVRIAFVCMCVCMYVCGQRFRNAIECGASLAVFPECPSAVRWQCRWVSRYGFLPSAFALAGYRCRRGGTGSQPSPTGVGHPGHGPHPVGNRYSKGVNGSRLTLVTYASPMIQSSSSVGAAPVAGPSSTGARQDIAAGLREDAACSAQALPN